jgi:hypothetical protein
MSETLPRMLRINPASLANLIKSSPEYAFVQPLDQPQNISEYLADEFLPPAAFNKRCTGKLERS